MRRDRPNRRRNPPRDTTSDYSRRSGSQAAWASDVLGPSTGEAQGDTRGAPQEGPPVDISHASHVNINLCTTIIMVVLLSLRHFSKVLHRVWISWRIAISLTLVLTNHCYLYRPHKILQKFSALQQHTTITKCYCESDKFRTLKILRNSQTHQPTLSPPFYFQKNNILPQDLLNVIRTKCNIYSHTIIPIRSIKQYSWYLKSPSGWATWLSRSTNGRLV